MFKNLISNFKKGKEDNNPYQTSQAPLNQVPTIEGSEYQKTQLLMTPILDSAGSCNIANFDKILSPAWLNQNFFGINWKKDGWVTSEHIKTYF